MRKLPPRRRARAFAAIMVDRAMERDEAMNYDVDKNAGSAYTLYKSRFVKLRFA
jgi:hypothetical protein